MSAAQSWTPVPKVAAAGGIGVPLATIASWLLDEAGVPAVPAGAIVGLIPVLIGYLTPVGSGRRRRVVDVPPGDAL